MVAAVLGSSLPAWIRSTRKATKEEDARGIDFVIETDKGTVYLQVKSSKTAAEEFIKRHSAACHLVIAAIVVLDTTTTERLRKQVLYRLTMLREKLMDGSLMEWLRERSGLVAVIDQALRVAVRDYGDIGDASDRKEPFPNALKKGLADAAEKFDEWAIARYRAEKHFPLHP